MADLTEFWIDVGGTFTDCLMKSPKGRLSTYKVLSSGITKGQVTAVIDQRTLRDEARDTFPADAPQRTRLDELRNYLGNHVSHLNYAERLREGRSIGSGQIEDACKNLIGRRLKQTAARWRVRRLNRMASLCSILYSRQWNAYGSRHAA